MESKTISIILTPHIDFVLLIPLGNKLVILNIMDVEINRSSLSHPLPNSETATGDVRIEMHSIVSTINLQIKNYSVI